MRGTNSMQAVCGVGDPPRLSCNKAVLGSSNSMLAPHQISSCHPWISRQAHPSPCLWRRLVILLSAHRLQAGVCAVYEGQEVRLSQQQLQQERSALPVLPPALFGVSAACCCCRTVEQVVQQYGAVHGQRIKGEG